MKNVNLGPFTYTILKLYAPKVNRFRDSAYLPTRYEMLIFTRYGNVKCVAKCRKLGGLGSPKVIENSAIR